MSDPDLLAEWRAEEAKDSVLSGLWMIFNKARIRAALEDASHQDCYSMLRGELDKAQRRNAELKMMLDEQWLELGSAAKRLAELEGVREQAVNYGRQAKDQSAKCMKLAEELEAARARIAELEGAQKPGAVMPLSAFREWLATGDRGLSSNAIVGALTGHSSLPGKPVPVSIVQVPHDAGDFGRCERLLRAVPEARRHLAVVGEVSPAWAALVQHWDELVGLLGIRTSALSTRIWDLIRPEQAEVRSDGE